jgi:hypothetical protein
MLVIVDTDEKTIKVDIRERSNLVVDDVIDVLEKAAKSLRMSSNGWMPDAATAEIIKNGGITSEFKQQLKKENK